MPLNSLPEYHDQTAALQALDRLSKAFLDELAVAAGRAQAGEAAAGLATELQALAAQGRELLVQRRALVQQQEARAGAEARERQHLLRVTIASTHSLDLQSFIGPDYVYRYVNDRYLEYWATSRERIEGHTVAELIGDDVFERRFRPRLDRALAGERISWETVVNYPGRGRRHVRAMMLPARDEHGTLHGVVMRVEDIDELMAAQVELSRTVDQLEKRNAEQQRFIHMISHDLREPLNSICNFSELLAQDHAGALDATATRYLGFVSQGGQRMRTLLDGLLDYVRLEGLPLQHEPVAAAELLQHVRDDLALQLQRSGGHLAAGALPTVEADPTLLRLLLQNLVSNAIKFHRAGEPPQVSVSDDSDATHWRIAVADRGIGIAPEHQARVFGLFRRLRSRREYEGSGLGLAIAQRIAELHGGHIELQSLPDEGSTFTIALPRTPAVQEGQ